MTQATQVFFLPGASGNTDFWKPVSALLAQAPGGSLHHLLHHHIGWPGLGPTPPDPSVASVPALVDRLISDARPPAALVAQSMGCVVALLAALARPDLFTHLVLCAVSGGIDLKRHGASDWRPPHEAINPRDPLHLFAAYDEDLAPRLPSLRMPILLLWGDSDPISPVAVGEWLATVLPNAGLHTIRGGGHTFANTHSAEVALLIAHHLQAEGQHV